MTGLAALIPVGLARAATAPVKEIHTGTFGTPHVESGEPGGFRYPFSVSVQTYLASPDVGDIYVADAVNERIQELTPVGGFVSMFGWDVDKTKVKEREEGKPVTQQEENLCTAASHDECGAGVPGQAAGQFYEPVGVTVDPSTGHVYVEDFGNARVQQVSESGQFIWMLGGGVNGTTGGNLCTAVSGDSCQGGAVGSEPGAFQFAPVPEIDAGGSEDLLYAADRTRVQEFKADGSSAWTFPASDVEAMTIAPNGDVYLAYAESALVNKLNSHGQPIDQCEVSASEPDAQRNIHVMALDAAGRLAITGIEHPLGAFFGVLYDAAACRAITTFEVPSFVDILGLTFSPDDHLYGAAGGEQDVWAYSPVAVGELSAGAPTCVPGAELQSDVTFDCRLNGAVDPWGVNETEVWAEWGASTGMAACVPDRDTEPPIGVPVTGPEGTEEGMLPVGPSVEALKPNESLCYRLAGNDENVHLPERFTSETVGLTTPTVAAKIVGAPIAEFVKSSSTILHAQLNPENANTRYEFEYAPEATCAGLEEAEKLNKPCPGTILTTSLESATYGEIGVIREAIGLQPATSYRFRLIAENESQHHTERRKTTGQEGVFTTLPAPSVLAQAGAASAVTATTAIISGVVNPGGAAATYTFQLAINNGAQSQYGTIFSGPTSASAGPIPEELQLTGLQPHTEYAFRVTIKSGYGESTSAPQTFMTAGLPDVITAPIPPVILPIPSITIPTPPRLCKRGTTLNRQKHCVRAKKKKVRHKKSRHKPRRK